MRRYSPFLCLVAAGLSHAQQPVQPPAPPTPPSSPTPPRITLVDPGAEPRTPLRVSPAADLVQSMQLRILMVSKTSLDGKALPSPALPAMLVTMTFAVKSVSPEGDIAYSLSIPTCDVEEDASAPAEIVDSMRQALAPITKVSGDVVVSSRGINRQVRFDMPGDDPKLAESFAGFRDQVGQLSVPFPEEAVGIGGRWRIDMIVANQGMRVNQTVVYTLKEIRDGAAILDTVVEQLAEKQDVAASTLPRGTMLKLESLKSTGAGATEQPLNRLLPRKSTMRVSSDVQMSMGDGERTTPMKQAITLDVAVTEVPATPARHRPEDLKPSEPAR